MSADMKSITYREAVDFLLPKHYSGRTPSITFAFGLYEAGRLVAVCTFGKPASASLCVGVAGPEFSSKVYELNRLCRVDDYKKPISQFVSACLRELKRHNLIIVSYSDLGMGHTGYIYQACNFLFTGTTAKRTDKYTEGNKHSRHYITKAVETHRKVRTPKNRYVYLNADSKTNRKKMMKALKYPVLSYPKAENKNYTLGIFQVPEVITVGDKK